MLVLFLLASTVLAADDGMVLVPAGEFLMGRTKLTKDDSTGMRPIVLLDDRPVHKVWLDAFRIDRTEVTQEQYASFLKARPRPAPYHWADGRVPPGQEKFPAHNVDWDDATAYCAWAGKRLPTEAEWERAARGGRDGFSYPWGDKIESSAAHYGVDTGPAPVARYAPNAFGLHDMSGSVSEWTSDWFERLYYQSSPARNPKGPETGVYKVIRGGAWSDSAPRVTVFFRNWIRTNQKTPNVGFRCVKDHP